MRMTLTIVTVVVAFWAACGDDDPDPAGGMDAGVDRAQDMATGMDMAPMDMAAPDAGLDRPALEAGKPNTVVCGGMDCDTMANVCCTTLPDDCDGGTADGGDDDGGGDGGCTPTPGGQMCIPESACNGAKVPCDGPEDCAAGNVCCGMIGGIGGVTVTCRDAAACPGTPTEGFPLCHRDLDCSGGTVCCHIVAGTIDAWICLPPDGQIPCGT